MALQEDIFGATEMALSRKGRFEGDENLWVQFYINPTQDEAASAEAGRPIFKDVEHIKIITPGNKESMIDRPITELDKRRFSSHYEKWKKTGEEFIEGTLLEEWPSVTRAQVEEMRYFNVRTVEQLANMSDSLAQKFAGIQSLKSQAKIFLNRAEKNAGLTKLNKELEIRDNQIQTLQNTLEALQQEIARLTVAKETVK